MHEKCCSRLKCYFDAKFRYDANGRLQRVALGRQAADLRYDLLDSLLGVTFPDGTVIDYILDGRNRRIGKKVNGTRKQGFLYQDALRPVAELDGSNNVVSRFVYATRINVPEYMIKNGHTYRIITDHLGSPRLVIDTATGDIAQRMDYDEFGIVTKDTSPGFQPFGFAGGLYDPDTGLVRFGARDYDADVGRWTARDPILFAGGDTNLYGYVMNDPLNSVDSSGLSWWSGFAKGNKGQALGKVMELIKALKGKPIQKPPPPPPPEIRRLQACSADPPSNIEDVSDFFVPLPVWIAGILYNIEMTYAPEAFDPFYFDPNRLY